MRADKACNQLLRYLRREEGKIMGLEVGERRPGSFIHGKLEGLQAAKLELIRLLEEK